MVVARPSTVFVHCAENMADLPATFQPEPLTAETTWLNFASIGRPGCIVCELGHLEEEMAQHLSRMYRHWVFLPIIGITTQPSTPSFALARYALRFGIQAIAELPHEATRLKDYIDEAMRVDGEGEDSPARVRQRLSTLSSREREVLQTLMTGDTSKATAAKLGVTFQTVDRHKARALQKMGVRTLAQFSKLICTTVISHFSPAAVMSHLTANDLGFDEQVLSTSFHC